MNVGPLAVCAATLLGSGCDSHKSNPALLKNSYLYGDALAAAVERTIAANPPSSADPEFFRGYEERRRRLMQTDDSGRRVHEITVCSIETVSRGARAEPCLLAMAVRTEDPECVNSAGCAKVMLHPSVVEALAGTGLIEHALEAPCSSPPSQGLFEYEVLDCGEADEFRACVGRYSTEMGVFEVFFGGRACPR